MVLIVGCAAVILTLYLTWAIVALSKETETLRKILAEIDHERSKKVTGDSK